MVTPSVTRCLSFGHLRFDMLVADVTFEREMIILVKSNACHHYSNSRDPLDTKIRILDIDTHVQHTICNSAFIVFKFLHVHLSRQSIITTSSYTAPVILDPTQGWRKYIWVHNNDLQAHCSLHSFAILTSPPPCSRHFPTPNCSE